MSGSRLHWIIMELLWLAVLLLLPRPGCAQGEFTPQFHPTLQVVPLNSEIRIDGDLSDSGWEHAAVAANFSETNPGDQIKPPVESKALITYDRNKLYIALIAYDNPATIRASWSDRDNIFRDDYFGLMLDTYGDASWGYELFVNPFGIQGDLRMLANGNEEIGFDLVWESRGKVTDSGYQVEIAIPFSSLRFPNKPEQTWRANFWRDHQRDVRRRYAWAAQKRGESCFMCQWGTLTGIKDIRSSTNLDLLPAVVAYQSGALKDGDDPRSTFHNGDPDAELGLNARYGLSSNASLELAVNPDFSQVESDATQIDVNTADALFYEERRPFFQEGSDLYSMWVTTVHTRTIVNPAVATKFTAKVGRTNVGYFLARDDNGLVLIPREEGTFIGENTRKSTTQVLRGKRTFGDDSFVGAIFTDRRMEGDGNNTVMGGDLALRFTPHYRIQLLGLASRTTEGTDTLLTAGAGQRTIERGRHTLAYDGETYWGHAAKATVVRNGRTWNANISYFEYSPTFRADNGFITRNDRRWVESSQGLIFRPNRPGLRWIEFGLDAGRVWNFDNLRKDEWLVPVISLNTFGSTEFWINYLFSRELYRNIWFPGIRRLELGFDTRFSGKVSFGFEGNYGREIARGGQLITPVLGKGGRLEYYATMKPTSRLALEPQFEYSHLDFPDSSRNIYDVYVFRTRVNYQFTREWFLRLVIEHVNAREFDGVDSYSKDSYLTLEPLVSYKLNPFTIFYVGSAHNYWDQGKSGHYYRTSQHFFAKLQYLIRA
ncbi:MAG: DUF5916 domain-containing protein [Candidatus Zixiibacteriota bacterium]